MTTADTCLEGIYPGAWWRGLLKLCQPEPHAHPKKNKKTGEWEQLSCGNPGKVPREGLAWQAKAVARWTGTDEGREARLTEIIRHMDQGNNVGMMPPPNVIVIDADDGKTATALEVLLHDVPMQSRDAAHRHYWVRVPEGVALSNSVKLKIKIGAAQITPDLRIHAKGQVAVAPSVHFSGDRYEWLRELPDHPAEIPDCPTSLLEALLMADGGEPGAPDFEQNDDARVKLGARHHYLLRRAAQIARKAVSLEETIIRTKQAGRDEIEILSTDDPKEIAERCEQLAHTGWEKFGRRGSEREDTNDRPRVEFTHKTDRGTPRSTVENLGLILDANGIPVRFNEMTHSVEMDFPGVGQDEEARLIRLESLCTEYAMSEGRVGRLLYAAARDQSYHPAREWIESKPWDGTDRLPRLLGTIGTKQEKVRDMLVRRWLVSCVAALYPTPEKHFKCRGVLTFQGTEAIGKTAWFARLVGVHPGLFLEGHVLAGGDKDQLIDGTSRWLVELGELESSLGAKDLPRLKAFITRAFDTYRVPYGRKSVTYPRATVFCASVNRETFLKDDPGGDTRFWVVPVDALEYGHEIDMQQVWAQVSSMYREGEEWWLSKEENEVLAASNEEHREVDPFEERIRERFPPEAPRTQQLTATEVLSRIGYEYPQRNDPARCGRILKRLGFEQRRGGGSGNRYYLMPKERTVA